MLITSSRGAATAGPHSHAGTIAITYSASGQPGGTFVLRACPFDYAVYAVYAEVEDQGSTWDGNIRAAIAPHGLFLLHALAATYGARMGKQGWIVWFTVASAQVTRNAPRP